MKTLQHFRLNISGKIFQKMFLFLPLMLFIYFPSSGQTYFHGGIYSNTTWTTGGSPYILTDSVVVFPGVTLTIQAGVTVKFNDNVWMEIRQSSISAIGTSSTPIIFTSSDGSPIAGAYGGIVLNVSNTASFEYCNFSYGQQGITGIAYTQTISNCNFTSCLIGLVSPANITLPNCDFTDDSVGISGPNNMIINNCIISDNGIGVQSISGSTIENCQIEENYTAGITMGGGDTLRNCQITYNGMGLVGNSAPSFIYLNNISNNNIGVDMFSDSLICNSICNNTTYNLVSENTFNYNKSVANNYWCTSDSMVIDNSIYDGYKNVTLGIVFFKPFYTVACTALPCDLSVSTSTDSSSICSGDSVLISANVTDGSYSYSTPTWNPGGYGGVSVKVKPTSTTTYTVSVSDAGECSATATITITVNPVPSVSFSGLPSSECKNGSTKTLIGSPSGGVFSGSGVSATGTFTPGNVVPDTNNVTYPDVITYTYTNSSGCTASASSTINIIGPPNPPSICYVSADSSVHHVLVFWTRAGINTHSIDSFIVYRQLTTDSFTRVSGLPSADSTFIDAGTNPSISSYIYELQVRDTCGQYSPLGPPSQTILLQSNLGVGSVVNLSWNPYAGNIVNYYKIYRDSGVSATSKWYLIDSVPGAINAFTDIHPPGTLGLKYLVTTAWTLSCTKNTSYSLMPRGHNPSQAISIDGITSSNPVTGSVQDLISSLIGVYPNPVKNILYLIFNAPVQGNVFLYDAVGKEVYNNTIEGNLGNKMEINISALPGGVYILKVNSNSNTVIKKIVKM